jgi:hypothetical protein
MTEIHVRKSERSNPEDEYSYPGYREAAAQSAELFSKMTFDSEAQKRDYLRKVRASRHNVPGLPAFFPPDRVLNKHRLGVVYKCTACDEEIDSPSAKCDMCGHQDATCPCCNQILFEGTNEDGTKFCKRCGQPLPIGVTQ